MKPWLIDLEPPVEPVVDPAAPTGYLRTSTLLIHVLKAPEKATNTRQNTPRLPSYLISGI